MRIKHVPLIFLSALLWFSIGIFLLSLGLTFIQQTLHGDDGKMLLIPHLAPLAGSREQATLLLVIFGLAVGFLKGRFVLSKSAARVVQRITSLPNPLPLFQAYGKGYLLLICGMVLLGMSLKWFHLPLDLRATIDIAIGSALMNGAVSFVRLADKVRKQTARQK